MENRTAPALLATTVRASRPGLRIGDAERETVQTELAEHYTAGRLSLDEYLQRVDAAADAQLASELAVLTVDLPRTPPTPAGVPASDPATVAVERREAPPVPRLLHPVVVADCFFAVFGPLATLCLLVLLLGLRSGEAAAALLATVGGGVGAGAAVHFAHRFGGVRPSRGPAR